ncbi:MAG: hypothetical protein HDQ87_08890 [Clostridia bacterium]|nr:hypothetical protein [Clostridia bacterium]
MIRLAEQAAASAAGSSVVDSSMNMMVIFDVFIAVYLLYYAIKGDGKLYENDFPKAMQEEHRSLLRKFCWITGVPMLVLSVLEYMYSYRSMWSYIVIGYGLTCVVVYVIVFRVRFGRYLKPEKSAAPAKSRKK